MTIADPKAGGWSLGELLTNGQMDAIRSGLLKAIDGVDGGTYSLSAPLIFQGDDVRLDSDDIDIVSGGELSILSGGLLSVEMGGAAQCESGGQWNVLSGGDIDVANGGTISLSGAIEMATGSQIHTNTGGTITIGNINNLVVDGLTVLEQWDGVPLFVESGWGGVVASSGAFVQTDVSTAHRLWLPLHLRAGDVLTQCRVRLDGGFGAGHGGGFPPATMPTAEVIRRNAETGVGTSIAGPTSDSSASAGAYDVPHDLTLGSISETSTGQPYAVIIRGEAGANAIANTLIVCGVEFTITKNRIADNDDYN